MKQFELLTNDFVTYVFYFVENELEHSEIHILRNEIINEIRNGYSQGIGLIENYKNAL
jgi:hypothetical protein